MYVSYMNKQFTKQNNSNLVTRFIENKIKITIDNYTWKIFTIYMNHYYVYVIEKYNELSRIVNYTLHVQRHTNEMDESGQSYEMSTKWLDVLTETYRTQKLT